MNPTWLAMIAAAIPWATLTVSLLATACGGIAVIDPGAAGGGGTNSSSPTVGSGGGAPTGTGGAGGAGGSVVVCEPTFTATTLPGGGTELRVDNCTDVPLYTLQTGTLSCCDAGPNAGYRHDGGPLETEGCPCACETLDPPEIAIGPGEVYSWRLQSAPGCGAVPGTYEWQVKLTPVPYAPCLSIPWECVPDAQAISLPATQVIP